ncbi:MAG: calcium/sodium antiporter [Butyricicoccus sp.]|nr:calcium/sodium antiporter [Butyricicoccus sp.]
MISILLLAAGFALLVWGADQFVAGASAAARKIGVPPLVIGLTIVAFGTSAPELAVSVTAALKEANAIAVGNVLGSNIFNLLGVAGVSAIVCPLAASRELVRRDWLLSIAAAVLLGVFLYTGMALSRLEGVILLALFAALLTIQLRPALRARKTEENSDDRAVPVCKIAAQIVFGLIAIVLGGDWSVDGATGLARMIGLSETVIGLTIVAIGTSLPELVTSLMAARRGENDIALGNVIGSNLFNLLFILGVSTVLNPIGVQFVSVLDALFLTAISVIFMVPAWRGKISRAAGLCMALTYVGYTAWLLIR